MSIRAGDGSRGEREGEMAALYGFVFFYFFARGGE